MPNAFAHKGEASHFEKQIGTPPLALILVSLLLLMPLWSCGRQSDSVVAIGLHPTNPNILYVATNESVYKTRDGGASWERISAELSARRVLTLGVDPQHPATVYAGTMGDAVYKSPDGGQRWLPHNVGLKEHISVVNQFLFDPRSSETMYAATTVGFFRTTDGGRLWEERMAGMKEVHYVVTIAQSQEDPSVLYAGTSGGVYRSTDGASTWVKINNGLIPAEVLEASLSLGVNTIAIDPLHPDTVYAGTTKGLFKTTNRGDSWTRIALDLPDQYISSLVIDPGNSQLLYAGGRAGVHKSMDGGRTWAPMNQGLQTLNIRTIVMTPKDTHMLYAGTNGSGLYVTRNGGLEWKHVPITLRAAGEPTQ
jgi:photosystem II stability/assembly factor-like uncharacterized protein